MDAPSRGVMIVPKIYSANISKNRFQPLIFTSREEIRRHSWNSRTAAGASTSCSASFETCGCNMMKNKTVTQMIPKTVLLAPFSWSF